VQSPSGRQPCRDESPCGQCNPPVLTGCIRPPRRPVQAGMCSWHPTRQPCGAGRGPGGGSPARFFLSPLALLLYNTACGCVCHVTGRILLHKHGAGALRAGGWRCSLCRLQMGCKELASLWVVGEWDVGGSVGKGWLVGGRPVGVWEGAGSGRVLGVGALGWAIGMGFEWVGGRRRR
jgi:hypothetical protein